MGRMPIDFKILCAPGAVTRSKLYANFHSDLDATETSHSWLVYGESYDLSAILMTLVT